MLNLNCGNSSLGSVDSLKSPYEITDRQRLRIQEKISPKLVSKLVKENCFVLSVALVLTVAFFATLFYTLLKSTSTTDKPKSQVVGDRFLSARWSWSFNASDVYNAKLKYKNYGTPGELDLGSDCGVLKWRPFLRRIQEKENLTEFPFFLEYITGPRNVPIRAWRSMVLMTNDGREIMQGSDFHRNGFMYSKGSSDNNVWAANSTYLTNTADNDPLTLKIEVFVDPTWVGCKPDKVTPQTPTNYEEECNRLPTNTKLYFNGSCYVGSNTRTQFKYAIRLCNDIPSAAISRLAWIESKQLLEKLREVFVIHTRYGKQVNEPYFIGAKQSLEKNDSRSAPSNNWYWIDSDENPKKPFASNFSLWTNGEPNDDFNEDEQYAAVFYAQQNVSDVVESKWFRYLCEYKDLDK